MSASRPAISLRPPQNMPPFRPRLETKRSPAVTKKKEKKNNYDSIAVIVDGPERLV